MITVKHTWATLIHLLITILGLVGLSLGDALLTHWYYKLGAALALCVVFGFFIIRRDIRVYTFKRDSDKLAQFFAQWYSQDGELSVFCDDLDWLNDIIIAPLFVKAKDKHLQLYLKVIGPAAEQLKTAGAALSLIPNSVVSAHKFSIVKNDNFEQMICRNKFIESGSSRGGLVEFINATSASDPYLIELAKNALSVCIKQP